ncbi:F0F1 ATP synthase subunit delta [Mycoplasma iguanae]|uniref:ATP synthase subunit delta n=1 Tax=Mycoplasma iguanae TaxID=292461 RepID=A0ABY5RCB1_9MOLU|nr:F0F1 ATP synthase subunit delta [Mycoplasma iguanae]UVD81850.1 F0F1 ATP synthase subunit delta [Mycoplasma iguanae]
MNQTYTIGAISQALLEIAIEEKKLDVFKENVTYIKAIFSNNPELNTILKSYFISYEEKEKLINNIFKKVIDSTFMNFLLFITEKKQIGLLLNVFEKFIAQVYKKQNITLGTIFSTKVLSQKDLKAFEKFIAQKLAKEVVLVNKIDPSLIAGIKIKVEDFIYEDNYKKQMEQMKNLILRGENNDR